MRYFTEQDFKDYYKKVIAEGEYATEITVGEYSTSQEANDALDIIRKQYGFGRYDSWVDGTAVKVIIEKDPNDNSYFPDMVNQMKNFGKQYKQIAENKKSKNMKKTITESQLRNMIAEALNEYELSIDDFTEPGGYEEYLEYYRKKEEYEKQKAEREKALGYTQSYDGYWCENKNEKKALKEEEVQGDYYVVAVDKNLSGWGKAKGGNSVIVVKCHTDMQAHECEKAMGYSTGIKVKGTYYGKIPNIKNAAHIQEMDFDKCPQWNRNYYFTHGMNENKKVTESQLRNMIVESIKKALKLY